MKSSELILNSDKSIFHLHLHPHQIAKDIILVGDPGRVEMVSKYFDTIEHKVSNREFVTHTGTYKNKRLSVISTGIGTDNIDIVLTELDAIANIDIVNKEKKTTHQSLNFVRIGTTGSLQQHINIGDIICSQYAIGMDNVLHFYKDVQGVIEKKLYDDFIQKTNWFQHIPITPYAIKADEGLMQQLNAPNIYKGITITACGFYGPQGRYIKAEPFINNFNEILSAYSFNHTPLTNFEMETSALYGLSKLLHHKACTLCLVIANRHKGEFLENYKTAIENVIIHVLENI